MASDPITSWQIDGEKVEIVTDFIFLGSKITVDNACSHEIKSCLLLGRKTMIDLDSIIKSRGILLLTKVHLVKAVVFPLVICGCESWAIKKGEHQRIDAFAPQFKSINSSALSFLYSPTLISIHDYWKNHTLD